MNLHYWKKNLINKNKTLKLILFFSDVSWLTVVIYRLHAIYCRNFNKTGRGVNSSLRKKFKMVGFHAIQDNKDENNNSEEIQRLNDYLSEKLVYNPSARSYQLPCGSATAVLAGYIFQYVTRNAKEIEAILGAYFQIWRISVYKTVPTQSIPDDKDSSFAFHYDSAPAEINKIFIYLDDVTTETGAFGWISAIDSMLLFKSGFVSSNGMRPSVQGIVNNFLKVKGSDRLNYFEGKAGSSFIFNNSIVHKATFPQRGKRTVICIEVYPSSRPLSVQNIVNALQQPEDKSFPAFPKFPWKNRYN